MKLAGAAVRYWQFTLIVCLLAALLGIQAFLSIPRSVDPQIPIPIATVVVVLPGADASAVEETVTKPIEDVAQGLENILEVRSTSSTGVAVLNIEFVHGTDPELALDRTIRDVTAIRDQLPAGITRLDFKRPRPTEAAVLQLALVSKNASWRRMEKYTSDLRKRLNVVPGVRATTQFGLAAPEVRVALDTDRLSQAGVSALAVSSAIAAGGAEIPAGAVQSGTRRFNVDAGGAFRTLAAVKAVTIRAGNDRALRVGDIATVGWAEAEGLNLTRFNGDRAVFIAVKQKDNVSAPVLQAELIKAVEAFRTSIPPDMKLEIGFDQSRDIERRLSELARDFKIALALVLVTLLPLGLRASSVVMVSIPLSIALGLFLISIFGFTLNQISIAGFIISLGLLVDDSIVVTENIERHLRLGKDPQEAAISGTQEISAAVLGSTGVLIFAFLPLAFLPDVSGDFVRGLPIAVLVTVASSLLVSLTVIPFMASRVLKRTSDPRGNRFLQFVTRGIENFYRPLLNHALANPRKTLFGTLILCGAVFATVPLIGFSLFPTTDAPYFMVRIEAPEGSGIAETDRIVRKVSAELAKEPEVAALMDNVGRGNPQVYYNNIPREDDTRFGEIFVTLREWSTRESPLFLDGLRKKFARWSDARIAVFQFEQGPPIQAPIAIRIKGPDLNVLKSLSAQVATIMSGTTGIRDVKDPLAINSVDLDLGVDYEKASLFDVTPETVRRSARIALSGERASSFRDAEGDSYPVTVRLPLEQNQPVSALTSIYVPSRSGNIIPLSQIATPTLKSVPSQITRHKLQRFTLVSGFNEAGYLASDLNDRVITAVRKINFPSGYTWEEGGAAEVAARSASGLGGVILLAVFGIFAVLVAEFGRLRDVLVVVGIVPLGIVGGLLALLITGNSLSFLAVIGFVALCGIEIKNSILLVDSTKQLRARGLDLRDAIEKAGEIRFLPVLLTSVTAIGGLLPLALSGVPLYAPLAWVIIGGLVSSTLLSRIVTPVMYLLVARTGVTPNT